MAVELSGTFFQPGIQIVVDAYTHKAQAIVANNAQAWVHKLQKVYFKNPSGYEARHTVVRDLGVQHMVFSSNATYGPWLEGSGSMNAPVTRFPGYHIYRKVAQEMDRQIVSVTNQAIGEACRVING